MGIEHHSSFSHATHPAIINTLSARSARMTIQTTANIWHNGKLIPWDQAQIHVMCHVVHYGSSVFEGIRCYTQPNGAGVFRLPEHMAAPRRLGQDLPHAPALHRRPALRRRRRRHRSQRRHALLHPPHRLPRLWRDGRQPAEVARSRSTSPTSPGANTSPATRAPTSASPAGTASPPTPCPRSPRPAPTT